MGNSLKFDLLFLILLVLLLFIDEMNESDFVAIVVWCLFLFFYMASCKNIT